MQKTFLLLVTMLFISVSSLKSQTIDTVTAITKTETKKHRKKKNKHTQPAAATVLPKDRMPVMQFDTLMHDFGTVKTGDDPTFIFKFKNTGNAPLNIELVSGCDCTELDWTKKTVAPGGDGFVKAIFHTKRAEPEDHKMPLKKYIDVILKEKNPKNDYPLVEVLTFKVFIAD